MIPPSPGSCCSLPFSNVPKMWAGPLCPNVQCKAADPALYAMRAATTVVVHQRRKPARARNKVKYFTLLLPPKQNKHLNLAG